MSTITALFQAGDASNLRILIEAGSMSHRRNAGNEFLAALGEELDACGLTSDKEKSKRG
jgi:hypothetical protein